MSADAVPIKGNSVGVVGGVDGVYGARIKALLRTPKSRGHLSAKKILKRGKLKYNKMLHSEYRNAGMINAINNQKIECVYD